MIFRTRMSGLDIAQQAVTGNYIGTPYSEWDCQAFVEQVLQDAGLRKPGGAVYNWRGSNSMFRNFLSWRGSITECKNRFGKIPVGSLVFIVKHDGGEVAKGYHDGLGNASHVGLFIGTSPNPVMDSQPTGGVQMRKLGPFTHVGLLDMIEYDINTSTSTDTGTGTDADALRAIRTIREDDSSDADCLKALVTLSNYLKEAK